VVILLIIGDNAAEIINKCCPSGSSQIGLFIVE